MQHQLCHRISPEMLRQRLKSQKAEILSLRRYPESTQKLFEDGVGTSSSSATRITEAAISHLPQAAGDPELFPQREHTTPKAAPKLAAFSSTPRASISKAPTAVPNSFIPTTTLPIESTDSTVTIPDCGKRKKRQDDATIIDRWLQPTAFRSWTISFKSEVCHSSQYPRAAVLYKSIDDLITSASVTGRPIPDFENLDFKIVQADSGRS